METLQCRRHHGNPKNWKAVYFTETKPPGLKIKSLKQSNANKADI